MLRIRFSRRFRRIAVRLFCYLLFVLIALILIYNKQIYPYVAAITSAQAENNIQQVFPTPWKTRWRRWRSPTPI